MPVYFLETEKPEQQFFAEELPEALFAEELADVPADAELLSVFIQTKIDRAFLDAHPKLRLVATRSTGLDHIDMTECARRGITVSNVPDYGENTVAEHTFALILALSRRLRGALEAARKGNATFESIRAFDLKRKTLGVVGVGRVGRSVIRIARGFEMRVIAYDLHEHPEESGVDFEFVPFEELLRESHVITLHVPLTAATHHLLGRDAFSKCRRGVIIVNTARGAVIDTAAMNEAMDSGIVGGAGLDVLEDERVLRQEHSAIIGDQILSNLQTRSPHEAHRRNPERVQELEKLMENSRLLARPNVVFTPHAAFNSVEAVEWINRVTVENITLFMNGASVNVASAGTKPA
ncbi:MAG: D-lactate dehydrogenase [Chthoniobacter sp.]|nr:D-lactate dehydrogenase [Chthoniobacter sp.]